jgi:predicted permease
MMQDVCFALRALVKRPLYSIITVVVLALAIGANATVFSVFNGFFLRPLPYPDGERLVVVHNTYPRSGPADAGTSIPDYLDRRAEAPSLEELGIVTWDRVAITGEGTPEQITVPRMSPSMFEVLGVAPALGRTFTDEEATLGNERVVVLSHTLWQSRFGGRSDILGKEIHFDTIPYTIIGVMPEGFAFPDASIRAWVPFAFTPEQMSDTERGNEFSSSIGRLAPGATLEGLNAELDAIVTRNVERLGGDAAAYIEATGFTGRARDLREHMVGDMREMLLVLQASVLAVLLIACANIANLQLARVAARRKELTIRAVLGARKRRLAALVLAESLVLALLGGSAGLALAHAGLALVRALGLDRQSQGFEFALDGRVIAFTAGAALLAAVVSALVPVWMLMREKLGQAMNEAGRLGGGGRATQAFRSGLVVVQIAMSVALLVGAGLLTKSFYQLQQQGPGFNAERVLTARLALPQNRYPDSTAQARFIGQAVEELGRLPGVAEAGFTTTLPFGGGNQTATVQVDGYEAPAGTPPPHAQVRAVDGGFFRALDIPVVEGRNFSSREDERVVIIDQNMARRYWPAGDALGQRVRQSEEEEWWKVAGVVPPVKHGNMTEDPTKETIYWPLAQAGAVFGTFTLRTTLAPEQLTRLSNDTIVSLDPDLPLFDIRPYDARLAASLGPQRAPMVLTLVFAAVAFTLAVVGVYGVLTWAVTQRYGELGVRMALGAGRADIMRLVVRQGGRLTAVGILIGIGAAVALGRAMASQIHHVSALDPTVFGVVIAGLAASALLASWIPARRAGRIDPMTALRVE